MARRHSSIGGFDQLWERHEKLYQRIFMNGLKLLKLNNSQREHEDAVSEALCPVLQRVCFAHPEKPSIPQWEMPIAPASDDELKGGKRQKRPDFTCSKVNPFAQSDDMFEVSLHIECKRLGQNKGSYNLNKNYVEKGIKRFDSITHEYGKRAPSGMMIGYIINSTTEDILLDVNRYLKGLEIQNLIFDFTDRVTSCDSIFCRKFVEPENFKLIHLWADVRQ